MYFTNEHLGVKTCGCFRKDGAEMLAKFLNLLIWKVYVLCYYTVNKKCNFRILDSLYFTVSFEMKKIRFKGIQNKLNWIT